VTPAGAIGAAELAGAEIRYRSQIGPRMYEAGRAASRPQREAELEAGIT